MTAILALIPGWLKAALGALVGGALLFIGGKYTGKREGRSEAKSEALEDRIKRNKDARDAASDEKRETDGLSDDDIRDRLRGRDSDWRGM